MALIICFIHCLECMGPIDDYDPEIDQYTCKKCRDKAAKKWAKRNKGREITPLRYDEPLDFDF